MGKKFDDYLKNQNKEDPEKKKTKTADTAAGSGGQGKFYSRFVKNETEALPVETNTSSNVNGILNTNARANGLTADRKQRIQNIVSQSGAALRNGALRPSGYAQYRQEIDDLIKSGASGELVKAKKDEYTQFKTDMYNKRQTRKKQSLLNKAEKDPDFNRMVELGKNRFDTLNQEKDKKGFRISFSADNGGNDLAEYAQRNYKLNNFTEDERNTYLYLLGKEGWKAADDYEKLIQRDVNARTAPKEYEFMRDYAKNNKAGAAAMYPAMGFFGGAALGDTVRQGLQNAVRKDGEFVPADNNSAMYVAPRVRAALSEGITDGMNEKQKFLAQTGLSALDFAATAAVGGGLTSGLGASQQAANAATLGLMGANAGGATSYEAIERGATPGQAAALGLASAAAEIAFEKIPVGHFMQMTNGEITATLGKEILKQAAEEGMEELGTEYVNLLADKAIMGNKAEMNQYITELMAQGVKANDAKKAAVMEFAVKRPAMAFLGGAVSGAGIGAAGAGIGRINLMTDPVMGDMVKAVQESTGLSKAKAWGVVIQAMQSDNADAGNITENAENIPENEGNTENVPALPETANVPEEESGADWEEDIINAVMADNNMSYEDAQRAVAEAETGIVPAAEQSGQEERIWERAAREQAEYDAEYERTHPEGLPEIGDVAERQAYEDRLARTENALREIEAQKEAKAAETVNNALMQRAVNEFGSAFGRFKGTMEEDFRNWLLRDMQRNGIPEVYQGNLENYVNDIISDLEYEVSQEYQNASGSTIEAKMRKALQTVLARDGRTSYVQAQPEQNAQTESATAEMPDNEDRFYGDNPYKYREDADEILRTAQAQARAKMRYDNEINKANLTEDDMSILRGLLATTRQVWKNGGDAVPRMTELLRRMNIESGTDISRLNNEDILRAAIEYTNLNGKLEESGRMAKRDAQDLAERIVSGDKLYESAKDKGNGFLLARETFERNTEDVIKNKEAAKEINDTYYEPVHEATKDQNAWLNKEREGMKALNIDTGKKKLFNVKFQVPGGGLFQGRLNEDGIVQAYGEKLIDDRTLDELTDNKGNKIDAGKIRHAVDWISSEYKKIIDSVNLILVEYGYDPIPERQNYFPHYTEDEFTGLKGVFSKLGIDLSDRALPTDIAGLTEDFRPGKQWAGNFLHRQGTMTNYGALRGMDKYVDTVSNVLFQTGNIQKLRALSDALRTEYAPEHLKRQIENIRSDIRRGDVTFEDGQNRINKLVKDIGISKLPNYVTWLDEYTNNLAGKNSKLDRDVEYLFGRKSLSIFKSLNDRTASNMVGYKMSTPFTNIIPITQADISVKNKLRGFYDTIQNAMNNDGLMDNSVFYANRIGSEPLIKTKLQTFMDKSGFLMNLMDRTIAESIVRGRYYDNIEKGMDPAMAMRDADNHAGRVMADRSKGAVPLFLQAKNPALKIITMFQTEANNQLSYMFKDLPRDYKDRGMAAVIGKLAEVFFGAFVFNELYEKVIGRRPAFDPIDIMTTAVDNFSGRERNNLIDVILKDAELYEDKEIGTYDAIAATAKDAAEELPFVGGILGGGRVPISDALPDFPAIIKNAVLAKEDPEMAEMGRYKILKEVIKPAAYLAPPAGGIQAKKTIEGLLEASQGASYGYNTQGDKVLRYPVENDSTDDYIRNALFGRTASEGYKDWKRNGFKNLNAKETERYNEVVKAGISYDAFMGCKYDLQQHSKKADKARALYENKDLTTKQKELMWDILTSYKGDNVPDFTMRRNAFYDEWKTGDEE